MIRRPPRSTHCISSAASDVYKRQAHNRTTEDIRELIGADSLGYLSVDRLPEISGNLPICKGCFTGVYPLDPPEEDIRGEYDK